MRIPRLLSCLLACALLAPGVSAQQPLTRQMATFTVPATTAPVDLRQFFFHTAPRCTVFQRGDALLREIIGSDTLMQFESRRYRFMAIDTSVTDELEARKLLGEQPVDLSLPAGRKEALHRLYAVAYLLQHYADNDYSLWSSVNDRWFDYRIGWIRENDGLVRRLLLYYMDNTLPWGMDAPPESGTADANFCWYMLPMTTDASVYSRPTPPVGVGTNLGDQAPDIRLPGVNGDTISLYSLRGRMVLIHFWASWCSPCLAEHPDLRSLYSRHKARKQSDATYPDFEIYSISCDVKKESWLSIIHNDSLSWPNHVIESGWFTHATHPYLVRTIPESVLIDENGIILRKGRLHPDDIDNLLETTRK